MKDYNKEITDLLIQMRKRPGVFIGKSDIFRLQAFLYGFMTALDTLEVKENIVIPLGFHDWVAKKYNEYSSVPGWANIIYEHEKELAVEKFFELLDEYRTELGLQKLSNE